ncbi:hypothetical protein BGZ65_000370 [Modicella reniformis]|uniref:Uncharacterized protein n=1 Tax=Modicella reniformis TaxID=1440133 RepID=A0A9P6MAD6_9FUNG|nr:hypothetical protein BGZ65_000370 [Modicella reniformis]
MTSISTYQKGARLSTFGPFNDLDVGDGRKADQEQDSYLTTPGTSLKSIATTASKRHPRISAEIMDGDVDGDLDWKGNPTRSFATNSMVTSGADSKSLVSVSRNKEGTRKHGYQDADQDCDFDSDMNLILGMASDMELIMPKFDDEYLEDLKNDPVLTMPCRRSSTVPTASPSTPCVASVESNQHVESLPAAALGVLASGVQGRSPHVSQQTGHPSQCPNLPDHSNANRDLSTIECSDCDSARHQRTSTMDMDSSVMKSSTYSPSPSISSETQKGSLSSTLSSSTINNERKNNGPIYFKPKYYSVSRQSHIGEHSQKDWNTTTTGELTFDSSGSTGMSAGPPFSLQRRTALSGHHIFRTQDPLQFPNMDGDTMMTVSNLSLVTANMNVLTPQEVQEDYYARRNLRMYQQRQRRRSSAIGALGGHSGTGVLPFRTEGFSPLARRSSSSDIQYFEKPVVPAIGASPLPASYYLPPSAFRTEADVAAEQEAERKRKEQEEEFKDSFLVFPSPVLS